MDYLIPTCIAILENARYALIAIVPLLIYGFWKKVFMASGICTASLLLTFLFYAAGNYQFGLYYNSNPNYNHTVFVVFACLFVAGSAATGASAPFVVYKLTRRSKT